MKQIILFVVFLCRATALPEQGAFEVIMNETQNIAVFTKSMYNGTSISVKITCNQNDPTEVTISWLLRSTPCAQEYADIDSTQNLAQAYFTNPEMLRGDIPYQFVKYQRYTEVPKTCSSGRYIQIKENPATGFTIRNGTRISATAYQKKSMDESSGKVTEQASDSAARVKRQAEQTGQAKIGSTMAPPVDMNFSRLSRDPDTELSGSSVEGEAGKHNKPERNLFKLFNMTKLEQFFFEPQTSTDEFHRVTTTWEDGIYLFIIKIDPVGLKTTFTATVDVRMKRAGGGFLSAIEWPLLPFYGVMCVVYVIFGVVWLILSACNWRDLLRIQFWIGGVIFLGMLEKAVFFSEHESIDTTGKSVRGAMLFGELVSCLKRTLARMLVIIVSLGFGIVKPRLGPMLHKVLAMGGLYFILSAVEACFRVIKPKSDQSNQVMLAAIPLAVLDAAICWWIFTGLVNTIRTLRLRRNLVKLSLYRHFTNTLIFAVVASVAFMVWSITQHKFTKCLSDWKELWVDEAFWHLLFSVILMVIMILWRPSANNQRYAFSPLIDAADDEAGEPMMNDAFDGMKMRGMKGQNGSPVQKEKSKADEDLKWIDENIPASVADAALPSLLDSDEEMMNTKYEMSKME